MVCSYSFSYTISITASELLLLDGAWTEVKIPVTWLQGFEEIVILPLLSELIIRGELNINNLYGHLDFTHNCIN